MTKNERLQYLKRTYPTAKPSDKVLQPDDFATELDAIELAQLATGLLISVAKDIH